MGESNIQALFKIFNTYLNIKKFSAAHPIKIYSGKTTHSICFYIHGMDGKDKHLGFFTDQLLKMIMASFILFIYLFIGFIHSFDTHV